MNRTTCACIRAYERTTEKPKGRKKTQSHWRAALGGGRGRGAAEDDNGGGKRSVLPHQNQKRKTTTSTEMLNIYKVYKMVIRISDITIYRV